MSPEAVSNKFWVVLPLQPAVASLAAAPAKQGIGLQGAASQPVSSRREELLLLTALDGRRVELEERNKRLDERQADLERREREFAVRLTQLKELSETLKLEREKNDRKKGVQLDQLANVYGSMDPREAAQLIEQLDISIALSLLERMPEKRIAQILSTMQPERALTITRMLSGKEG